MATDPLIIAANAISDQSPKIKAFALQSAARTLTLEARIAALELPPIPLPPPLRTTYALALAPNWNNGADSNDVLNNYNAVWQWSNNGKGYAPPNGRDVYRVLLLDPRLRDSTGKAGVDEWWFCIRRFWPASYDPKRHGDFDTETTFHNVATNDSGPNGGVGWGFGSGVSAILFQWRPQDSTPSFGFEYVQSGGVVVPLPAPKRDAWHTYELRFVAGRIDGTAARTGSYEVFADSVPIASDSDVNTLQRAKAPDGQSYTQKWIAGAWDGSYTKNLGNRSLSLFQLTGCGLTRAEAQADVPKETGNTFDSQKWNGKQPNLGAPTLVKS